MYRENQGHGTASVRPERPSFGNDVTTDPVETATDRLNGSLEAAANRLHLAIDRVRGFADHMLGGAAVGNAPLKDAPGRSGRAGQLQDRVDHIHASLSTLESEIERLGSI